MASTLLRMVVAVTCVLAVTVVRGQDRSQYTPVTPTLTERLGQMRESLFGDGEPDVRMRPDARSQNARAMRGTNAGMEQKAGPQRPSQSAAPSAGSNATGRGFSGVPSAARPQSNANRGQADGRALSPEQIQHEDVPTLARRPSFNPAANANSKATAEATTPFETSRGSLQDRLSAARGTDGTQSVAARGPDNGQMAAGSSMPTSSRRGSPFSNANASSSKVQEMINPMASPTAGSAQRELPSLARSAQPAVAGPAVAGPATPPGGDSAAAAGLTSSRRGFSSGASGASGAPTERVASIVRDRAASVEAVDGDVLIKRQSPMVSISTSGPRTIMIGKEASYIVSAQNVGDAAAQDVAVTIRVPEWADVVGTKETSGVAQLPQAVNSAGGATAGGGTHVVQWTLPRLEAHGKEQLTLQIVPRQSRPFDLAVQLMVTPISSSAQVEVKEPKLVMNLTGPAEVLFGDTKIYKMTLSNPGSGDAENVVIHLSPLNGQSGPPTKHQIGAIKAGDNKVIEVELTARQSGKVMIHAAATAEGGLQADVSEEVTVRRAELEMKIVGGKAKYAGTVAAYQIKVLNPGNAPAENVQVVATLPAGAKFLAGSNGGQASADGAKVQWTIPTIRAGGDSIVELKCQVNNPGTNRLAVQSTATGELTAAAEEITQVEALADLKLDVIEPKGPIAVGADVTYEIHVRNRGTKNASDVKVMGYFSGKIEPTGATGGEHRLVPGIVIFKPIASIASGSEATFKISARAKAPGNHMFKAEVVCESAGAKLGSEHTTLFYGDEVAGGSEDSAATEDATGPLAPKIVFESDDSREAEPAPLLQKTTATQAGSAYAPSAPAKSGSAPAASSTPAQPSGQSSASTLPVSPFSLRANAKKK